MHTAAEAGMYKVEGTRLSRAEWGRWRRCMRHIKAAKHRSAEMMSKAEIKPGWGGGTSDGKTLLRGWLSF